jgi:SHS2 domain-containing protein
MAAESALMPGHLHEEHTGELRIRIWARSLPELFEEAARALAGAMGGTARDEESPEDTIYPPEAIEALEEPQNPPPSPSTERLSLEAHDHEALLVDWLNELIFRAETGRKIYTGVRIESIDARGLTAEITGYPVRLGRTFVKAATFHGLRIEEVPGGLSASVLLDI